MLNNILGSIVNILRGKNGGIFLIVGVVVLIVFISKILSPLIELILVGGALIWLFYNLEKKLK